MPSYRVIVHGRNFRLNMAGKWEKFRFYTPRFAEASDPVLAEDIALGDFRRSAEYLYLSERSLNAKDDEPVLCGEDIAEVLQHQGLEKGLPVWHFTGSQMSRPRNEIVITFYGQRTPYDNSELHSTRGSNHTMQPTAGRCIASLHFMRPRPFQTELALASGG